jgi:hypothetical protein
MNAAWNPAVGENFTKVMRQIRDGQRFAVYKQSAYTDKQMVNMGEKSSSTPSYSRVPTEDGWSLPRQIGLGRTLSCTFRLHTKSGR